MKRKVVSTCKLKLSPNEEACILKEDYERRRKLRLLQVREQERDIASQIREDIKQRRNQHFTRLAEELKTEWEESQTQKIKNLEKLYLASLRTMGEGHQQAKENEPDLNAPEQRAAERKRKAEVRHKEALKVQKDHKEMLTKEKTWHLRARQEALLVEKERSAKITSLPPPPPALFENIEVSRVPSVRTSSTTYHHLHTLVNREVDTEQPDPRLAAEEEAERLDGLQKQAAQERAARCERAQARGSRAMERIHLAQNQEKLMKELEQLQQEDLARRRRTVARMPAQLVELPYKRGQMREDWQRELEFAFEDMYSADRKVTGNLILHLEPEPPPTRTSQAPEEELDLSLEQGHGAATETLPAADVGMTCSRETDVPVTAEPHQVPSKILFKKLLNKIRTQKSLWTIQSASEDDSEAVTTASGPASGAPTEESGLAASEGSPASPHSEPAPKSDALTVDSGPLTSEDSEQPPGVTGAAREQGTSATPPVSAGAPSSVLLHPHEEAARIRMAARQKQMLEIEEQKQRQLELLEQIEQQKLRLESVCREAQREGAQRTRPQQLAAGSAAASHAAVSEQESHRRVIREYQQQLLQHSRLHRRRVDTARKQLLDYQTMLRGKHPPPLGAPLAPAAAVSALRLLGRPRRGPDPCLLVPPAQTAMLDAGLHRAPTHSHLPQSWAGAPGASGVSVQPASDSREQPEQLPQTEAAQGGAEGSPPRLESGTAALPPQGPHLSPPLATGRPAGALPAHEDPGEVPESLPAGGTSAGSVRRPVSPTPGTSLPSARAAAVQWGHLQALQQQLQLQKATLRRRQHAQEQLLLHRQKELEGWAGLPLTSLHLHASLPSARAGPGRVQEPDPAQIDAALPSGHPEAPQAQETCVGPLQPAEPEQAHPRPLPGPTGPQGRDLQAGREARTQQEADSGHWCGQARAWAFSSLPPTSMPSGKSQEQSLSERGKGPPSGQASEGALRPLQRSLKLLQERLAAQRAALWGRPEACTGALSGGGETGLVTAHADAEPGRTGFGPPAERRAGPWGDPWTLPSQGASPGLLQQGSLSTPQEPALAQRAALGAGREPGELARSPPACTRPASTTAGLSTSAGGPSAVAPGHAEMVSLPGGLQGPSRPVPPLQGAPREPQAWPGAEGAAALHLSQDAQGHVSAEHTRHTGWCPPPSTQAPFTAPLPAAGPSAPWAPLWAEGSGGEPASRGQSPQLQDSLWRTSQPGQGSLQALQQRLAAQRETIIRGSEAQEGLLPEAGAEPKRLWGPCLAPSDSSTSSNPSGPPRLPGGPVGVSRAVLPQHGCRGGPQGPWSAQMRPHPCGRGAQGARPCSPPRPCEAQPVPLDHSGVKTSWQQLDAQRRTLRALDGAQEELLRCRPSELGKRVRAELGRSLPSPGLAGPDSGSHQGPRPTAALPGSPGGPALPRQVPWTVQLDSKGMAAGASEDAQADAGGGTAAERRAVERTPVLTPPPRTEEQPGRLGASSLSSEPVSRAPNGSLRRPSLAAAAPEEDLGLREHLEPQEDAARCGQRARAELPGLRQELDRRRGTLEGCSTGGWVRARLDGDLGSRASKPPVTKVQCGVDWTQHELSAIQEVASPASGQTPRPAAADSHLDRDPLRASISWEQGFLASPGALGPLHAPAHARTRGAGPEGAGPALPVGATESAGSLAMLSHAAGRGEPASLGPALKPEDEAEAQEVGCEPSPSVTLSTGSLLSYGSADVSHVGPVDLDFPELGHASPALHHQLFRPLEPHPDFDLSSFSEAPQDSRDFEQSSDCTCESRLAALSPAAPAPPRPGSPCFCLQPAMRSPAVESPLQEPPQSFRELLPEPATREESQHADLPSVLSIEAGAPAPDPGSRNRPFEQAELLQGQGASVQLQPHAGSWLSSALGVPAAVEPWPLSLWHSAPGGGSSNLCSGGSQEGQGSLELSGEGAAAVLGSQEPAEGRRGASGRGLDTAAQGEETDPQLCVRTVGTGDPAQTPGLLLTRHEEHSECSSGAGTTGAARNPTPLTQPGLALRPGPSPWQSCAPVWDTESNRGIMEEPELTLVSASDTSITEMDLSNLTLEERENEAKCFRASESLPLMSETETAHHPALSEPPLERPTASAETPPTITATPGSLQEAFARRKKKFIERSLQRQEEIKSKIRVSQNSQSETTVESTLAGSLSWGKHVKQAGALLPKDRKKEAIFARQTALRYNQLAEVKQQKEERARQEAYAQNRARAKEFHKKTLERLRAKHGC